MERLEINELSKRGEIIVFLNKTMSHALPGRVSKPVWREVAGQNNLTSISLACLRKLGYVKRKAKRAYDYTLGKSSDSDVFPNLEGKTHASPRG